MDAPQTLIADRYRLVRPVGTGGMGVVWEAWDERLERRVAVKQLRAQPGVPEAEAELAKDRAMREARITARLHHRNAVAVFDVVEHQGQPCLVMQFVPSVPLSAVLKEGGPLLPAEAARLGAEVASALAAAHELGIVHRDVKPGNILVADDGSALLSDFGISHALGDATLTSTGLFHGTPAYLSPEVARGARTSAASDVYSLGATLYAALEGEPPFGTDPNSIALLHRVAAGDYPAPQRSGAVAPAAHPDAGQPPRGPAADAGGREHAGRARRRAVGGRRTAPGAGDGADGQAARADPAGAGHPGRGAHRGGRPTLRGAGPAHPGGRAGGEQAPRGPAGGAPSPARPGPGRAGRARGGRRARRRDHLGRPRRAGRPAAGRLGHPGVVGAAVLRRPVVGGAVLDPAVVDAALALGHQDAERVRDADPDADGQRQRVGGAPSAADLEAAIRTYYGLVPDDLDRAWPLLTARYQSGTTGGRASYGRFWGAIDDASVRKIRADPPDRVQAEVRYDYADGRRVEEVTAFGLVRQDGVLKIDSSEVVSSDG